MSNQRISNAAARLQKELMELMMSPIDGVTAFPEGEDIFNWLTTIMGPEDTPYANLEYTLRFKFSETYPL